MVNDHDEIRYSIARFLNHYWTDVETTQEIHFYMGTEALPTLWEFEQMNQGATIVERGAFYGADKIRGIVAIVDNMNLIKQYVPGRVKEMIECFTPQDQRDNCHRELKIED